MTKGQRGTWQKHLFLTPGLFGWGSSPRISSRDRTKPLISAANAEVTMASVHLDQQREAVSGRRVAFEAQSGGFVARAVRWPCFYRLGCLRAWRLPSAPGSQMWGPRSPGRCPCVCAAWTAGSSTGLCCAPDGLACSLTGCCSR